MRCYYIRAVGATFFQWRIQIVPMRLLRLPGVEVTDETGKLPPYSSAALKSAPHPLGRALLARFFYIVFALRQIIK